MEKIKCRLCGKTLAFADTERVEIKCSGKHDGHKCGCVTEVHVKEGEVISTTRGSEEK